MGGWEDVQVGLGLKSAEEVKSGQSKQYPETPLSSTTREVTPSKVKYEHRAGQRKAKSKMIKLSRRQNRKR